MSPEMGKWWTLQGSNLQPFTDFQGVTKQGTPQWTPDGSGLRKGFEICEVIKAWPHLPEVLRQAILGIVRSQHTGDLSTNEAPELVGGDRGCGSASREAKSSRAGAKPEQPVCGQVGKGTESSVAHLNEKGIAD